MHTINSLSPEVIRALVVGLRTLRQRRRRPPAGICACLGAEMAEMARLYGGAYVEAAVKRDRVLQELGVMWPGSSGDPRYPVPGTDGENPSDAYIECLGSPGMWDRRTAYGRARWAFLDYCIETLQGVLEAETCSRHC